MVTPPIGSVDVPQQRVGDRQTINLLITAGSPMDCQLLAEALNRSRSPFSVVGCVISHAEAIRFTRAHCPDVALISESLEDGSIARFELLREIRSQVPGTKVVVLAKSARRDLVIGAFQAGARGVFCQADPVQMLCKCIRAVHEGQVWANSAQLCAVLDAFVNTTPARLVDSRGKVLLTKREEDVVRLVSGGCPNREVAEKLELTEHTVSNYLFRIYDKLGISSRAELILYSLGRFRNPD